MQGAHDIQQNQPHVYVVVTNWNGWKNSIECLESLLRMDYPNYTLLLCDNASSDSSLEQIRRWAQGEIAAEVANPLLAGLTTPPVPKPVRFLEIHDEERVGSTPPGRVPLVLLHTGSNGGYARGCNAGIRYALAQGDFEFVWTLNNDIVVRPDALTHLVERMKESPQVGICGATVLYYHTPARVQVCGGGRYNKWLGRVAHIGKSRPATRLPARLEVETKMDYVYGAAMLIRRSFLEEVGLMDEDYFAYFEELDWAARAKGRFSLAYGPSAVIYHKEGGTLGTNQIPAYQSLRAEYYSTRNRIGFTRRYHPLSTPSVLFAVGLSAVDRSLRFRWKNVGALIRGAYSGFLGPPKVDGA